MRASSHSSRIVIAIFGAEYVPSWLPKGSHHWRKLAKPTEIMADLGDTFEVMHRTGGRLSPFERNFHYTGHLGVNYMMILRKVGK